MKLKLLEALRCDSPETSSQGVKKLKENILHRYRVATGFYETVVDSARHAFHTDVIAKLHYFLDEFNADFDQIRFNALITALNNTDRFDFVDSARRNQLWGPYGRAFTPYQDSATPILLETNVHPRERSGLNSVAYEQTCSQPSLVLFMLYLLHLQPGMKVLEVGGGCGYAATLAAKVLGTSGSVVSIEYFQEIYDRGLKNLKREFGSDFSDRVLFMHGDGSNGYSGGCPYNAIFLSAGAGPNINMKHFESQLVEGGRLVIPPQAGAMQLYVKRDGKLQLEWEGLNVGFVPLRGLNSEQK